MSVSAGRPGLVRTSGGISVVAGLGVLGGFLVDATMAALFGAGAKTDAFFIAATIPFALAAVFMASANQALVPAISGWFTEEAGRAPERVGRLLGTSLGIASLVSVVGVLLSRFIPFLIAPGSDPEVKRLAVVLSMLLFATVTTRVGVEVLRALLNARFSFLAPAAAPLVESGSVLVALALLWRELGVLAIAIGYVAGGVFQIVYLATFAWRRGLGIVPRWGLGDPHVRRSLRLLALPVGRTGLNMLTRAVERFLASFLPTGSITILNYAWVIVNSIGGAVFFRSVVVALLPRFAEQRDDPVATRRTMADGLRIMGFISLPLGALLAVLAVPLVFLAFQRGAFTPTDARLLGAVLAVYALSFPLDALTRAGLSYFYARLEMVTPFLNGVVVAAVNVGLALALLRPLGLRGLALAYVVATVAGLLHATRSLAKVLPLDLRPVGRFVTKVAGASLAGAGAAYLMWQALPAGGSLAQRTLGLLVPGGAGLLVFAAGLLLLRVHAVMAFLGRKGAPAAQPKRPE